MAKRRSRAAAFLLVVSGLQGFGATGVGMVLSSTVYLMALSTAFSGWPRACRPSDMPEPFDIGVIWDFAIALLIGALIGVEREKRKSEGLEGIGGSGPSSCSR